MAASETVDIIEGAGTATAGTIDTDSGSTMNGTPPQRQSVVDDEANAIWNSVKRSQLLPLASTNCEEYVSCLDGRMVRRQACAEGLLFDAGMQGCNWNYAVDCPEYDEPENEPSSGGGIGGTTGSFNIGNIIFSTPSRPYKPPDANTTCIAAPTATWPICNSAGRIWRSTLPYWDAIGRIWWSVRR